MGARTRPCTTFRFHKSVQQLYQKNIRLFVLAFIAVRSTSIAVYCPQQTVWPDLNQTSNSRGFEKGNAVDMIGKHASKSDSKKKDSSEDEEYKAYTAMV